MSAALVAQIRAELSSSRSALENAKSELSGVNAAFKLQAKQVELVELLRTARDANLEPYLILDVQEAARRIDYALVSSVIRGRRDGSIETNQDAIERAAWEGAQFRLKRSTADKDKRFPKIPVRTFLTKVQTKGQFRPEGQANTPPVWLFGEVEPEQFEEALSVARRSLRLTLTGVLKTIVELRDSEATSVTRVNHVIPSNRKIMRNVVTYLQSAEAVLSTVPELSTDVSPDEAKTMLTNLRTFHSHFNRIQKLLKNRAEQ